MKTDIVISIDVPDGSTHYETTSIGICFWKKDDCGKGYYWDEHSGWWEQTAYFNANDGYIKPIKLLTDITK